MKVCAVHAHTPGSGPRWRPTALLPLPPHASPTPQDATNFAVFSGSAWGVSLCLFREADLQEGRVTEEVLLDPLNNKTGDVWHIALPNLDPSLLYGAAAPAARGLLGSPIDVYVFLRRLAPTCGSACRERTLRLLAAAAPPAAGALC